MRYNLRVAIKYWLGVVSEQQAAWSVRHGVFCVSPGLRETWAEAREADGLVLYCPRRGPEPESEPVREFMAIGRVTGHPLTRVDGESLPNERWRPWQRRIEYFSPVTPIALRLMSPALELTNAWDWAQSLRRGLLPIGSRDFAALRAGMAPLPPEDRPAGTRPMIAPGEGLLHWE